MVCLVNWFLFTAQVCSSDQENDVTKLSELRHRVSTQTEFGQRSNGYRTRRYAGEIQDGNLGESEKNEIFFQCC